MDMTGASYIEGRVLRSAAKSNPEYRF